MKSLDHLYVAICALLVLIGSAPVTAIPTKSDVADSDPIIYTVKVGDSLTKIATEYGNIFFWLDIYEANRDKITNPDVIYPGQKLRIPLAIATNYIISLDMKEVQKMVAMSKGGEKEGKGSDKKLEKFRKAFKKVVKAEKKKEKAKQNTEKGFQGLSLGGLILDETRTKMGRDFYSIFYKKWRKPKNAKSFTITISEQPIPSRGTLVQVEINDQLVFRNRLEPRYYKTERAAEKAIAICRRRLQQMASVKNKLRGY